MRGPGLSGRVLGRPGPRGGSSLLGRRVGAVPCGRLAAWDKYKEREGKVKRKVPGKKEGT